MILNPILTSVKDVQNDQGGRVSLFWGSTYVDTNTTTLPFYSIWHGLPNPEGGDDAAWITSANRRATQSNKSQFRTTMFNGKMFGWELMGRQEAHRFGMYSYTASTLFDSVSTNKGIQYYLVSAQTNDPNVFYDSNIDSGYSVDNLAPTAPANVTVRMEGNAAIIRWDHNTEQDLAQYEVYRSVAPQFDPDTMAPLRTTTDNSFSDPLMPPFVNYYYALKAVDIHGNRSAKSSEAALILVGVREETRLPNEFGLEQNYPNPFNPSTRIDYALPAREHVRLSVYNVLGQEVALLVNDVEEPGYKTVSFDASVLPSGVYTYTITAGMFTDVKKMLLVK
jgi:hypothetical protein